MLQVARSHQWPVQLTDELSRADAVLAGRNQLGRDPDLRRRARDGAVPIHVIKADSLPQVRRLWSVCCVAMAIAPMRLGFDEGQVAMAS